MPTIDPRLLMALALPVIGFAATSCSSGGALGSAEVEPVPGNALAATLVVTAQEPVRVQVTGSAGDHEIAVPRTAEPATRHEIPVVGMRAGSDYDLEVELTDGAGEPAGGTQVGFSTGELPEFIAELEVDEDARRPSDGVTLVELTPGTRDGYEEGEDPLALQHVVALDGDGEVVWYQSSEEAMGDVRITDEGRIRSINFPGGLRETDLLGNLTGYWTVSPEAMPWTDLSGLDDRPAGQSEAERFDAVDVDAEWVDLRSIHHEVDTMPDGNLLALSNTLHELTAQQRAALCPGDPAEFWAISDVVVEFTREGEVVRTWDMWDVLDVMETPGEEMCSTTGQIADEIERDWTHGNSVTYDAERDAVIVSNRHTSQIVALAHGDAQGPQAELLWTIGTDGTIPLEGDLPRYQHAVEVEPDGSLIFYDNGNGRVGAAPGGEDPPYSRAAVIAVEDAAEDPSAWRAEVVWEHRGEESPGTPLFAGFLGDADRLDNGNVLIDHGGIPRPNPEDDFNRCVVIEVEPDGEVQGGEIVWTLRTGSAERPMTCYRTERVTSLYSGPDWE